MKRAFSIAILAWVPGCGGAQANSVEPDRAVVCPEGSVLDPSERSCVAQPAVAGDTGWSRIAAPEPVAPVVTVPLPSLPDPPAAAKLPPSAPAPARLAVTVTCGFAKGWVSILPVSKYPKDDSFLMQALIGFTEDPSFWNAEREYAPLKPFAARPCGASPSSIPVPAAGDYFVLVGEEGTFAAKGQYDKNGIRNKVHVDVAGASFAFSPADLTHTWLCISCPWVRFEDPAGRVTASFVVLANRRRRALAGTDRIAVRHVPVVDGHVRLRLLEREAEVSHVDELGLELRAGDGRSVRLLPLRGGGRSALAARDGVSVELARGTEVTVEYAVPEGTPEYVDLEVVATGYYDPQ